MLDIDFIPQVINSLVSFLRDKVPEELINRYYHILNLSPLDQKSLIQRELKPYEFTLNEFIHHLMITHGLDPNTFSKEHQSKFKRYLEALIEAV